MKRYNNLYKNVYDIKNIINAYNEVCKNTKNKRKVEYLKEYKSTIIATIYKTLIEKNYKSKEYTKFIIYETKKREIVSQNVIDKIVNHLVARYILYVSLLPPLINTNVASRKNMGTSKGLFYSKKFKNKCDIKYKNYYILKCDISKFFASINHDILKEKLKRKIKDKDALKIVFDIIDTNDKGVYIGTMTSQILAIFYLNDLDHFIKETLKIKYYVRYQDDFLLYHESKEYLKFCLEEIKKFLDKEKLQLNSKTRIYKNTNNFLFLGRDKNNKYSRYRNIKRKIKKRKYLYANDKISLNSLTSTLICYRNLTNNRI